MTIYGLHASYIYGDKLYYIVCPYNLKGLIQNHFRYYFGFKSLIPFLTSCRLTEKSANKVKRKKNIELGWKV